VWLEELYRRIADQQHLLVWVSEKYENQNDIDEIDNDQDRYSFVSAPASDYSVTTVGSELAHAQDEDDDYKPRHNNRQSSPVAYNYREESSSERQEQERPFDMGDLNEDLPKVQNHYPKQTQRRDRSYDNSANVTQTYYPPPEDDGPPVYQSRQPQRAQRHQPRSNYDYPPTQHEEWRPEPVNTSTLKSDHENANYSRGFNPNNTYRQERNFTTTSSNVQTRHQEVQYSPPQQVRRVQDSYQQTSFREPREHREPVHHREVRENYREIETQPVPGKSRRKSGREEYIPPPPTNEPAPPLVDRVERTEYREEVIRSENRFDPQTILNQQKKKMHKNDYDEYINSIRGAKKPLVNSQSQNQQKQGEYLNSTARPFQSSWNPHPRPATEIKKGTVASRINQINGSLSPDQRSSPPPPHSAPPGAPVSRSNNNSGPLKKDIVATARGIFGYNGGVLSSLETGVSLVIPEGAIPYNTQQEIYFKVCQDENSLPQPANPAQGEKLMSPMVMCGPHGLKFNVPIELRLPHRPERDPHESLNLTQNQPDEESVSILIDHF